MRKFNPPPVLASPETGKNAMLQVILALCAALFTALAALVPHAALALTGDKAEFRKLADGVYAFVGKRNDANALVVVTAQGVVLVDTGNNPPETRILRNFIKSVTDQP